MQMDEPIYKQYLLLIWCPLLFLKWNFKGHLNGICKRFLFIFKQNSDANS